MKRLFRDTNLWLLLALNIWSIIYYEFHPDGFDTILWLYWFQSVMIGLFNFLDIITIPRPKKVEDAPVYFFKSGGCTAFFFLFHFEGFHLVYAFFLLSHRHVDGHFLIAAISLYAFNLVMLFFQHKKLQKTGKVNIGVMFFMPYLRIIPMHLMILAPIFLHIQPTMVFLVLKTVADVIMYIITSPVHKKPETQVSIK